MLFNSRSKTLIVMLLALSQITTGCSAQWIKVALADLPILVQMALNVGNLVTTLQSGKQLNAADAEAIQNISNQAARDLNLLQSLYNEYQSHPGGTALQKIQNAIGDINQNLPALLQAVHISDPALSARVTAAVNLMLSTVNGFAALIPQPSGAFAAQKVVRKATPAPTPADLKRQWNEQVCGASGNSALESARSSCEVK